MCLGDIWVAPMEKDREDLSSPEAAGNDVFFPKGSDDIVVGCRYLNQLCQITAVFSHPGEL